MGLPHSGCAFCDTVQTQNDFPKNARKSTMKPSAAPKPRFQQGICPGEVTKGYFHCNFLQTPAGFITFFNALAQNLFTVRPAHAKLFLCL
jgi:hypothetical protein